MEGLGTLAYMLLGGGTAGAILSTIRADVLAANDNETIRRGPEDRYAVALTFDDGPDPVFTPRILNILAHSRVPATFFVVGKRAEQYPDIIRAMANAGHEVGNHTYRHRPLWLLLPHQTRQEIDRGAQVLTTILGMPPRYFRPPWGRLTFEAIHHTTRAQQRRVHWSLRAEGWLPLARPETIVQSVAKRLHSGAIINLHDAGGLRGTPARTAKALPALLGLIQERGYRCLTLSDLLSGVPLAPTSDTLASRMWDGYECAWNAVFNIEPIDRDAILALGPARHYGPKLILRDGTNIHPGAVVGELHLDRSRVAHLHRTTTRHHLGLALLWVCLQVHFFPAQKSIISPFRIKIFG